MMNYVCIEEGRVIGVFSYKPNTPDSVTVVEISDEQAKGVEEKTHFFDLETLSVKPRPQAELDKEVADKDLEAKNSEFREFLNSTDWKVMRHIRQQALGIPTTLSEEEYVTLEQERQNAANSINNV